ncbi:MAG TPA: cytochrome c oxidase assembly protein, partial [Pseudolabrys sp.]|nr:cytochrome c oxidase assembly protein [Pseudolabrys sp.]
GEVVTALYKVTNMAARPTAAQASYNVTPPTVGAYFNKINCFCFTKQTMKPGETREMTVVFYVDPSIVKDRDQNTLNTITLSYTFYRLPDSEQPVAAADSKADDKKL